VIFHVPNILLYLETVYLLGFLKNKVKKLAFLILFHLRKDKIDELAIVCTTE
jgi:hypothetical protein